MHHSTPLTPATRNATGTFLMVMAYGLLFYCVQVFLYTTGIVHNLPNEITLERWDAGIYHIVAKSGYYYHTAQHNNAGVYILFPWVWKMLHAGVIGVSFFNLAFFAAGFTIVTRIYPITTPDKLLWLTTPSLYFMWVPYSEALFCLLSAISFYGIAKNNKWITWAGLFLVSLSRATAVFLIPALLVMALLSSRRENLKQSLYNYMVLYALPTIAGTGAFVLIQFAYTGQWFPYFKGQATYLGHKLSWPALPFYNFYGEGRVTWLSALAMLPCVIAIGILIAKIYKWLTKGEYTADKIWLLSLGYLPIILFTMVFCNPKWGIGRTNLLGIHRYVFCSPYFFVFLYHMVSGREYKLRHFVVLLLVGNAVWLTMGSYWHIQFLLFYNFNTLLAMGYMLHANKKPWATPALCAVNLFFQTILFQQFLAGMFTD